MDTDCTYIINGTAIINSSTVMDVSTVLNSTIVINGSAVYICTTVINGKLPSGMAEELSKALVIIDESTRFLAITSTLGSGCSTVVELTPHNREVVGSNPARCWAFLSLLYSLSTVSLIQVTQGGTTLLIFL